LIPGGGEEKAGVEAAELAEKAETEIASVRFVVSESGTAVEIPEGYIGRNVDNGKGLVYQPPGAKDDVNAIRIMEPTDRYPTGYVRIYNNEGPGQPLGLNGKPGTRGETHIPL
jgi:hypothetical protein